MNVDAVVLQQAHLVLHQCNQGRYHDAYTGAKQGGQLEAQRLAATGRHDREQVAVAKNVAHDLLLPGTERVETKSLLELGSEGGGRKAGGKGVVHPGKHSLATPRAVRSEIPQSFA